MRDVWFTSDTHFGHRNIVLGSSAWENKDSCRDFKSVAEHDEALIECINSNVKQDDILYHLGDWSFGGVDNVVKYRQRLYVKEINLCLGNHDHHIAKVGTLEHSVFSSVQPVIDRHTDKKFIGGYPMFMSHYKHAIWPKSHKGVIHLYGHSHSNAEEWVIGKSMDVGIDNAVKLLGEPRPFHLDEIVWFMKRRNVHIVDHHDPKDKT